MTARKHGVSAGQPPLVPAVFGFLVGGWAVAGAVVLTNAPPLLVGTVAGLLAGVIAGWWLGR